MDLAVAHTHRKIDTLIGEMRRRADRRIHAVCRFIHFIDKLVLQVPDVLIKHAVDRHVGINGRQPCIRHLGIQADRVIGGDQIASERIRAAVGIALRPHARRIACLRFHVIERRHILHHFRLFRKPEALPRDKQLNGIAVVGARVDAHAVNMTARNVRLVPERPLSIERLVIVIDGSLGTIGTHFRRAAVLPGRDNGNTEAVAVPLYRVHGAHIQLYRRIARGASV